MSLSELLAKIGDENIEFQLLHSSFKSANAERRDGTITFFTSREKIFDMGSGKPKQTCLIVWVSTEKLDAAMAHRNLSDDGEAGT